MPLSGGIVSSSFLRLGSFCCFVGLLGALLVPSFSQAPRDDCPPSNRIVELNRQLKPEQTRLVFEPPTGYLRSVLQALSIPVESQIVVFSKTSLMQKFITPQNPRTLYFNDEIAVGWVPGEPIVEVATADSYEGIVFYALDQQPSAKPVFYRHKRCVICHEGFSTLPIPRMIVRSTFPAPDGSPIRKLGEFESDDRSPFHERWGGSYVTGRTGSSPHLGNTVVPNESKRPALKTCHLESLMAQFDTKNYLTPFSDVVALLVFEHQMRVLNLLTRVNFDMRFTEYAKNTHGQIPPVPENASTLVRDGIDELADSLLFVGEAQMKGPISGNSGFAEAFAARGPRDAQRRSLRQFDLKTRLMRYPCSYLIYSRMFDVLPVTAREAVYRRLWNILSREERSPKYAFFTLEKRKAIVEILRSTKEGLPNYFRPIER